MNVLGSRQDLDAEAGEGAGLFTPRVNDIEQQQNNAGSGTYGRAERCLNVRALELSAFVKKACLYAVRWVECVNSLY